MSNLIDEKRAELLDILLSGTKDRESANEDNVSKILFEYSELIRKDEKEKFKKLFEKYSVSIDDEQNDENLGIKIQLNEFINDFIQLLYEDEINEEK